MSSSAPSSSWCTAENEEAGPFKELETNKAEVDDDAVADDDAETDDEATAADGNCSS